MDKETKKQKIIRGAKYFAKKYEKVFRDLAKHD